MFTMANQQIRLVISPVFLQNGIPRAYAEAVNIQIKNIKETLEKSALHK